MKILVIPDIHGSWKRAIKYIKENKDSVDKVICLGDYVDDWEEEDNGLPMINGFKELTEMANAESEKFDLLIGNHDNSYLSRSPCSGNRYQYFDSYVEMFKAAPLKVAVEYDGIIFSHAGVTIDWWNKLPVRYFLDDVAEYNKLNYKLNNIFECFFDGEVFSLVLTDNEDHKKKVEEYYKIQEMLENKLNEICSKSDRTFSIDKLNELWKSNYSIIDHCGWNPYGDSIGESPVWIRPTSLIRSEFPPCKYQVVGHTEVGNAPLHMDYKENKIIICDNRKHDCYMIIDTEGDDVKN